MPARISLREFCQRVVESGLMTAEEVIEFRKRYPSENRPATADAMARELVYAQKLTPFQAGRLIEGQQRSLILGNNVLLEKIGEGGMGEVYKAMHRRMRRLVCVKILRSSLVKSESALKRFHREVQAAAQLSHPNIVTAFDADESAGTYFLVMEFVEGVDLGTLVSRNGPLTVRDAVRYVAQAARGLEFAHAKGIVHRDIKPGNLLLDNTGTVKILDMGLARFDEAVEAEQPGSGGDGQKRESLTKENQIVGTVEYMSPEQADDSGRVDRRSDIYSLGCTLFRLLTGGAPYHADSPLKVLMAHRLREIPSLSAVRPDVPPTLDAVFRRMVAKSPTERFQTMAEVLEALRPVVDETDFELGVLPPRPVAKKSRASEMTPTRTMTIAPESPDAPGSVENGSPANGSDSATEAMPDGAVAAVVAQIAGAAHGAASGAVAAPANATAKSAASGAAQTSAKTTQPDVTPAAGRSSKRVAPPTPRHTAVGIDLGTTYSVVACLDEQGHPHALPNSEGEVITPSVVLFDADELVVGKEALKALSVDAELVAECAKRELGGRAFHQAFRGRQYPPEVIEAHILNKLRQDAGRVIGEVRDAVITVPAYFDENRRKATQDAGYMAGLRVLDIINEPTAAALAFGFHRGYFAPNSRPPKTQRILVYDLGGGTFDVTVMEIRGVEFHTLATDGDVQLGGRDWDQRLLDYVAEQFVRTHRLDPREDLNTLGRLRRDCDEAKRTLSARQKTHVVCDYRGLSLRVEIARTLFQELTYDLLERTSFTTRMAMQAAHLDWKDLDRVLLVGGATRMPAVSEMLRKLTGTEPDNSLAPDEAVALGAALHAGLLIAREKGEPQSFSIRNVNSHSLGVVGTDAKTGRKQNAVLIPRNTPLPAVAKRIFKTHKPGQTSLLLQIVEGESSSPDECAKIGRCSIRGLPPDLPAQTPLDVRFHYAENGRITVSVHLPGQAEPLEQEITRDNSLTQQELDEWRKDVAKRK